MTDVNTGDNPDLTAEQAEVESQEGAELETGTEGDDTSAATSESAETATAEGAGAKDDRDQKIEDLTKQVREMDGRVGSERGHKVVLQRLVKAIEKKEGAVNRDELASELGMDRSRLDGYLDAPLVDDDGEYRRRAGVADKQLKAVAKVLKANGKDADQISMAYGTMLSLDESERERFMNVPEDELGAFIIERVNDAGERVSPIVAANGNVLEALDASQKRIAELEAENAQLKVKSQSKETRVPLTGAPETYTPPRRQGGSIYEGL